MRVTTGHVKPKVVVSDPIFPWWLSPCIKSEVSIDSFQRYWSSKNTATWLVESTLGHTWRTRLFPGHAVFTES